MTLARFPRWTLRSDRELHRIHRATNRPWWFSGDAGGRFDPVGTGLGACYLAERPLAAWVEVFRKSIMIADTDIENRRLVSVAVGRTLVLADVASRRALAFGVTAALSSGIDYAASQDFSNRAAGAGFDGVRYLVRHDPAQKLYGVALFGTPGAPGPSGAWPDGRSIPIPSELVDNARRSFGCRVMPGP